MAEVTEADRERAYDLAVAHQTWCHWQAHGDCCGGSEAEACDCGTVDSREDIAAALAEERERARAEIITQYAPILARYFEDGFPGEGVQ